MSVRTQVREIICHVACNHHEDQNHRTRDVPKAPGFWTDRGQPAHLQAPLDATPAGCALSRMP